MKADEKPTPLTPLGKRAGHLYIPRTHIVIDFIKNCRPGEMRINERLWIWEDLITLELTY